MAWCCWLAQTAGIIAALIVGVPVALSADKAFALSGVLLARVCSGKNGSNAQASNNEIALPLTCRCEVSSILCYRAGLALYVPSPGVLICVFPLKT